MIKIQQITDAPLQSMTQILPDGTSFNMTIYFVPMQYSWVITTISYQGLTINGFKITNSPNILYQYKNQLPFGLACFSTADREPSLQQDFSSNASILYLLTAAEVQQYSEYLASGK